MSEQVKLCIAGSRHLEDYEAVCKAVLHASKAWGLSEVDLVLSGGCRGVDKLGERWAKENRIPVEHYLPEDHMGDSFGARAHARNHAMAWACTHAVVLLSGAHANKGSRSLYKYLRQEAKPHAIFTVDVGLRLMRPLVSR